MNGRAHEFVVFDPGVDHGPEFGHLQQALGRNGIDLRVLLDRTELALDRLILIIQTVDLSKNLVQVFFNLYHLLDSDFHVRSLPLGAS